MVELHYLDELNPEDKVRWNIRIRVIRIWEKPDFSNTNKIHSIDHILIDEKGSKIQASMKTDIAKKFQHILQGGTYNLSNFGVYKYHTNTTLKCSRIEYRIVYFNNTSFKEIQNKQIPLCGFEFVDFTLVKDKEIDMSFWVDVIGHLVKVGHMNTSSGIGSGLHKRREILLQDLKGVQIKCTLWDAYAEMFDKYQGVFYDDNVVVIIHFGKIGDYIGNRYISNNIGATSILIDDSTIPELLDFKDSLKSSSIQCSDPVVIVETQDTHSIEDHFIRLHSRKTVNELNGLIETKQVGTYVTLATIQGFNDCYGWFYNSCKLCKKKVIREDNHFWCGKCLKEIQFSKPRFKVLLSVEFEGGNATFIMFEKETQQVIHKSVEAIIESLGKDVDIKAIPGEFNVLLNKEFLFKVEIKEDSTSLAGVKISKMTDDIELINKFKRLIVDESNSLGELEETNTNNTGDCTITPLKRKISSTESAVDISESPSSSSNHHGNITINLDDAYVDGEISNEDKRVKVKLEKLK